MNTLRCKLELIRLQTSHTNIHSKQGTAILLAFALAIRIPSCSNEKLRADKLYAGDVLSWQGNLTNKLALRRDLQHAALTIYGVPHVSIHVNAVAVWLSGSLVQVEHSLVGDATILRVVVGVYGPRCRMSEV